MKTMVRMNNIKNSLFLSALSVFALTSCVSEIADLNNIGKETGTMELNVDIAQPQTRAKTEVSNFPVTIYDADGKPINITKGYSTLLREYDKDKNLLWETTLGADGALVTVDGQYAAQTHSYDYSGHHTKEMYLLYFINY